MTSITYSLVKDIACERLSTRTEQIRRNSESETMEVGQRRS